MRPPSSPSQVFLTEATSLNDWHTRLGHPHSQMVSKIIKDNKLPVSHSYLSSYSSCRLGKLAKLPFSFVEHTTDAPF